MATPDIAGVIRQVHERRPGRVALTDDREARGECTFFTDLAEAAKTLDRAGVRRWVRERYDYLPMFGVDAFTDAHINYAGDEAEIEASQAYWAAEFDTMTAALHRARVTDFMRDHGQHIRPGAWPALIRWIADWHSKPKAFFMDPAILGKIPDTGEIAELLSNLPDGGFPGLRGPLRGARKL